MTPGALLWLAFGGTFAAGFAAIGAKVLQDFSAHELEELCERRRQLELFGQILDQHEEVAVGVESLQAVGTAVMLVSGVLWLVLGGSPETSLLNLLAASGLGALVLLAATVWIPWAIVRYWAAPFLLATWRIWFNVNRVLLPLSVGAAVANFFMRRLAGPEAEEPDEEEAFEEEIRAIVTEGLRGGLLKPDAREMIEGIIDLGDADVADIMTPRNGITAMHIDFSWEEMLKFVIEAGRSRVPVYERTIDNIVGILYAKDLLPELSRAPSQRRRPLRELLRRPWFVPKTKPVDALLRDFLKTRNHLAIVVDEFHAVAGVVSIEDVLEEIVGEIVDEYDVDEEEQIRQLDDASAEVVGHAHLDEINEQLGCDLPEDGDFDTIGGLVFSRLGRIPKRGEQVQEDDVRITVIEATRRRIERVRIELLEHSPGDQARRDVS